MRQRQRLMFSGEHAGARGFSLIEVLVALIIIGVGMLGIAKIQALAYASTSTASLRSLAAIEASSLAAAMRANRNYWSVAAATVDQTISVKDAAVIAPTTDGTLMGGGPNCSTSVCSNPAQLAAYDLAQWAQSLSALLPSDTAAVTCLHPATNGYPVGCQITVSWIERNGGIQSSKAATPMTVPTYTLYVEP
jgi:type IV pilus assembly protein PilV